MSDRRLLVAACSATLLIAACGSDELRITNPTGFVTITPLVVTLEAIGATAQLTAEAQALDGSPVPSATFLWASTDESVVTVDQTGVITAVGPGAALVVAIWDEIQGVASIDVDQVPTQVVISPQDPSLAVGASLQLTFDLLDVNGFPVPGIFPGTWSSSDGTVATVSTTGLVDAVGAGQAVITYDVGTGDGSTTVDVTP